jgi:hypothetical protein
MSGIGSLRAAVLAAASTPVLSAMPGTARAQAPPDPIDEAKLVPSLGPTFTPWMCQAKQSGPVCTGERHLTFDWALTDFTGHVTDHGATTRYVDAPFAEVLPDATFASVVCEAATGSP